MCRIDFSQIPEQTTNLIDVYRMRSVSQLNSNRSSVRAIFSHLNERHICERVYNNRPTQQNQQALY